MTISTTGMKRMLGVASSSLALLVGCGVSSAQFLGPKSSIYPDRGSNPEHPKYLQMSVLGSQSLVIWFVNPNGLVDVKGNVVPWV